MVVGGIDTSADATFTDALCTDQKLADFTKRVYVSGISDVPDTAVNGTIELMDGQKNEFSNDLAARMDNSRIEVGLRAKANSLIGISAAETLWSKINELESISARR